MSRRLGTYLVKTGTVHPNFVFLCYHNLTKYLVLSSTKSLIHLSKRKYLNFTTIRNTWYSWLNFAFLLVSHKISYKNPFYWFKIGFKFFFHWHIKHLWHLRQNTKTTYLKFQSPGIELIDKYIDLFIKILRMIYQNWQITQIERGSMVKITILFLIQNIFIFFWTYIDIGSFNYELQTWPALMNFFLPFFIVYLLLKILILFIYYFFYQLW